MSIFQIGNITLISWIEIAIFGDWTVLKKKEGEENSQKECCLNCSFWCCLEEGSSVLLLPSLHPVTVDLESTAVNETTNEPCLIGNAPNVLKSEGLGSSPKFLQSVAAPNAID